MQATRALVKAKVEAFGVAPSRVFFAGISMGGTPSYTLMAQDVPNIFAKAVVCSGAGDVEKAPSVTAEVRIFNGADDNLIDPEAGRAMADAINAAGGKATYYLLQGYDHRSAAEIAFSTPQWDWFFMAGRRGTRLSIR